MYEESERSPHFCGEAAATNVFSLTRTGWVKMFFLLSKEFLRAEAFNKLVSKADRMYVSFCFCFIILTGECCNTKETRALKFSQFFSWENVLTCGWACKCYTTEMLQPVCLYFLHRRHAGGFKTNRCLCQTGDWRRKFMNKRLKFLPLVNRCRQQPCKVIFVAAATNTNSGWKCTVAFLAPGPAAFKALLWCSSQSYVITTPTPSDPHHPSCSAAVNSESRLRAVWHTWWERELA